jgi:hypothetical protein
MAAPHPVLIAVTGDDPGSGDVGLFRNYLAFFREHDVRLTLFVIPKARGRPLYEDAPWVAALRAAQDDGHDLQLHGLEHRAFEFGFPPDFMLDRLPRVRARLDTPGERQRIAEGHSVAILRAKLEAGMDIFRRALGIYPVGFRAPAGMVCPAMFEALAAVGMAYDSSLILSPRGWHAMRQRYDPPDHDTWDRTLKWHPFPHTGGVWEVPIASEYSAHATWDDVDLRARVFAEDYDRFSTAGGLFVPVNHPGFFMGDLAFRREFDDCAVTFSMRGTEIYRRLFEHVRARANGRFCTLTEGFRTYAGQG